MNKEQKLAYYDSNVAKAINEDTIDILLSHIQETELTTALKMIPEDIKLEIIDKNLHIESDCRESNLGINSWDDFYEMYDGKFDDKYMLEITLKEGCRQEILDLNYAEEVSSKDCVIKPGIFKLDKDNNLVLRHYCPDHEIFDIDAKHYLDELSINRKWLVDISVKEM